MGEITPGVLPQCCKTCFVFCYQCNVAFQLVLYRFWPVLKAQTWIAFHIRTPVKNFWLSVEGVFHISTTGDFGTVNSAMLLIELQVKWHNFWRRDFRGLFDIPWMCLLYVSSRKTTAFRDRSLCSTVMPLKRATMFSCSPGGCCSSKHSKLISFCQIVLSNFSQFYTFY